MDIGIGLPSTIPGVERDDLLDWARRAETHGFSTLGVLDRLVYPNLEPLMSLAAVAAVTERISLTTAILITPFRTNTAVLAKEIATLDRLSNGRLVLGAAIGGRPDDYTAGGLDTAGRGRKLEQQIEEMRRIWAGEKRGFAGPVGPPPTRADGPSIILGGRADVSFDRAARLADGWIAGGGGPGPYREMVEKLEAAWKAAGRTDTPRKLALAYFSLGSRARETADAYLLDYYAIAGPYAEQIAASAAVDEDTVRTYLDDYTAAGCDELILFPCSTDPGQVDLLADAALRR